VANLPSLAKFHPPFVLFLLLTGAPFRTSGHLRCGFTSETIPSSSKRASTHLSSRLPHPVFNSGFDGEPQPYRRLSGGKLAPETTSSPHQPPIALPLKPGTPLHCPLADLLEMAPVTRRSLAAATDDAETGKSSVFCSSFAMYFRCRLAHPLLTKSWFFTSHLLQSKFLARCPCRESFQGHS
jgi:hypothetical protein